jgi:hypothetical protein
MKIIDDIILSAHPKTAVSRKQAANWLQLNHKFNNEKKFFKYFSEIKKVQLVKFEGYI